MKAPDHFIPRRRFLATGITALGLDSKKPVKWGPKTEKVLDNAGQTGHPRLGARLTV